MNIYPSAHKGRANNRRGFPEARRSLPSSATLPHHRANGSQPQRMLHGCARAPAFLEGQKQRWYRQYPRRQLRFAPVLQLLQVYLRRLHNTASHQREYPCDCRVGCPQLFLGRACCVAHQADLRPCLQWSQHLVVAGALRQMPHHILFRMPVPLGL